MVAAPALDLVEAGGDRRGVGRLEPERRAQDDLGGVRA